jgi:hypothetical protein
MAVDKWTTGDTITEANINKRGIRRGTTAELDAITDGDLTVGDLLFDTTLSKYKFVTVVVSRAYALLSVLGTHQFWVPATACWPATTNPCSDHTKVELVTNDVDIYTLDFAGATANEAAKYDWVPAENWDAGSIKCKPYWTAGAGAGTVEFEFSGGAFSNDDALDGDISTGAIASSDTFTTADDLHISPQTAAITINGTPAKADWIQIKILRDQATDTKAEDAKFMGFMMEYSIDAPNSTG